MKLQYCHYYDDIINLPYKKSKKHPPMSLYARSAQFAPFAALTGYEDAVKETGRLTSDKIEIDDELKTILDGKLRIIEERSNKREEVSITYFVPDSKKSGGAYLTVTGIVKKIDEFKQIIIFSDKREIPINDVIDISGKMFNSEI